MKFFVNVATKQKSVILFDDVKLIDMVLWDDSGKESEHVLPGFTTLMERNSVGFDNIDSVIVVHGPGAFTGLRVAMSVVNTIHFVYPQIQLKTISVGETFSALTREVYEQYIFQIYPSDTFVFDRKGSFIERVSEYASTTIGVAGEVLQEVSELAPIPSVKEWGIDDMQAIEKQATSTEGIIVAFYAKDPNITVRKQL